MGRGLSESKALDRLDDPDAATRMEAAQQLGAVLGSQKAVDALVGRLGDRIWNIPVQN